LVASSAGGLAAAFSVSVTDTRITIQSRLRH
jgi:hypothetical protein